MQASSATLGRACEARPSATGDVHDGGRSLGHPPVSTARRVARYARFVATTGRIPLSGTTLPGRQVGEGKALLLMQSRLVYEDALIDNMSLPVARSGSFVRSLNPYDILLRRQITILTGNGPTSTVARWKIVCSQKNQSISGTSMRKFLILVACIFSIAGNLTFNSYAVEIRCIEYFDDITRDVHRYFNNTNSKNNPHAFDFYIEKVDQCSLVEISGIINPGDAEKFTVYMDDQRYILRIVLISPGGSVKDALTMGRIIRERMLRTQASTYGFPESYDFSDRTCGLPGRSPCCSSACALTYFGGAEWSIADKLGLHRPTSDELGNLEYEDARSGLAGVHREIESYLREMEAPPGVFDTMMATPSNSLTEFVVDPLRVQQYQAGQGTSAFPPTIYEWLAPKCRATPEPLLNCMSSWLGIESNARAMSQTDISIEDIALRTYSAEVLQEYIEDNKEDFFMKLRAEQWLRKCLLSPEDTQTNC